jgi:hypothetical protein
MASKRVSEKNLVVSSGAAQASPVRKPATSRRTTRSAKLVETPTTPTVDADIAVPVTAAPVIEQPAQEAIAALAYSYWVDRGCEGGSPDEDWLRAEQELRAACTTA